ncbi:hypothetical protein [Actinoplanes sp. N902-109]|uniref:hypothetical protein n=1 Tax=Actinoplanes sp. (strain N902-109) TaxID=649831 RepID=UPI0003296746|nr:hypothetical protein [Actinoplanes sp. N902-109]AGL16752.1 hypothetical protein L083_3242 [Actinoplanes sp. N902-109]
MKKPLAVAVVVAGLVAAASVNSIGVASAGQQAAPGTAPAAVATTPAAVVTRVPPALKDSDPSLRYVQDDRTVTVTRKSEPVATVTLASAHWSAHSAEVGLTVAATRPFVVDPAMFTLYDAEGWENQAEQTKPVHVGAGTSTLTLTFTGTPARPEALGWVPQPAGDAVAVWERH